MRVEKGFVLPLRTPSAADRAAGIFSCCPCWRADRRAHTGSDVSQTVDSFIFPNDTVYPCCGSLSKFWLDKNFYETLGVWGDMRAVLGWQLAADRLSHLYLKMGLIYEVVFCNTKRQHRGQSPGRVTDFRDSKYHEVKTRACSRLKPKTEWQLGQYCKGSGPRARGLLAKCLTSEWANQREAVRCLCWCVAQEEDEGFGGCGGRWQGTRDGD